MSKVYFTNMRCGRGTNLLKKLSKLLDAAGFDAINWDKRFAALKLHFGEPGNLSALRPNWAKVVADKITAQGGLPFLTDCSTMYVGRRSNALDHIRAAWENGYNYLACGCPIVMGDGLKGTDFAELPVPNGEIFKTAFIGRVIADADIIVSLNHFKGHQETGFGGALKNLGMGCASRAGKVALHNEGKGIIDKSCCTGCGYCAKNCAVDAIVFDEQGKAAILHERCVGCGRCFGTCAFHAIYNENYSANERLCKKIAEYSGAVVAGKPHFHISVAAQISPNCDCHNYNDAAIVPDVGIFASFDPVALDHACIDMVNTMPKIYEYAPEYKGKVTGAQLGYTPCGCGEGNDHFALIHPGTDWRSQLEHGVKIGLGEMDYEVVEV